MAGPKADEVTGDFEQFKTFMRRLMGVPHSEIKSFLDEEADARKRRPRRAGKPKRDPASPDPAAASPKG